MERPVRLPHFVVADGRILSLNGRVYSDDALEAATFALCDGDLPLSRFSHPLVLESMLAKNLIAMVGDFAPTRRTARVLVASPHIDDAALSVGGLLRRGTNEYVVVNFFSNQMYQTGLRIPEARINDVAIQEDTLVGRLLGFRSVHLGLWGAKERHHLTTKDILQKSFGYILGDPRFATDVRMAAELLIDQKRQHGASFVLAPLGLGGHIDHLVISGAVFSLIRSGQLLSNEVAFYEDLPYATASPPWSAAENGQSLGLSPSETLLVDIAEWIRNKQDALRVYRTRIRKPQIDACITHAKLCASEVGYCERLWHFSPGNFTP